MGEAMDEAIQKEVDQLEQQERAQILSRPTSFPGKLTV